VHFTVGPNMYILGAYKYILGANMYILGANKYILGVNMYILGEKQPQWQLLYLFFWECTWLGLGVSSAYIIGRT